MSERALHPIERSLLRGLANQGEELDLSSASKASQISLDQTRRAVEWLKEKGLVDTREEIHTFYSLGPEGMKAAREGLPERRLILALEKRSGSLEMKDLSKVLGNDFTAALGIARKNHWIEVSGSTVKLLPSGKEVRAPEELMLEQLSKGSVEAKKLSTSEKQIVTSLMKRFRGLVVENSQKEIFVSLTVTGRKTALSPLEDQIDAITPQVLRSGEWRNKPIRPIEVLSPSPNVYPGRKHPMRIFMNEVREAFISLGFDEILGPVAHSALWNFDALFIPQKHSAREMQDTFYLQGVKAELGQFKTEVNAIKSSHENGGETGSLGWKYNWSENEAQRVVLRTHTTAVTISYLAKFKPEDARVFTVGKVFRNEKSNYKHNPEFYQIEGVMVGKNLNLRNLIFIISNFYSKLGFKKIKFWPTYFPYTEPSLQTMVYYEPTKSWMELGGMGIFRPEVTIPLGVENPVLAWGLSLDRLVMLRYNVKDIRQLFGGNLDWLRELKIVYREGA